MEAIEEALFISTDVEGVMGKAIDYENEVESESLISQYDSKRRETIIDKKNLAERQQTPIEFVKSQINIKPFKGEYSDVDILADFEIDKSGEPRALTEKAIKMKTDLALEVQKAQKEYHDIVFKFDPLKFPEEVSNREY